jgi:DNA-binding CsgD family transcriptional regulator
VLGQVALLVDRAAVVLGWTEGVDRGEPMDARFAWDLTGRIWDRTTALLAEAGSTPGSANTSDLVALLDGVRQVEDLLHDEIQDRYPAGSGIVRDALALMRRRSTVEQLIRTAPEIVIGLGFDRVLLSRIEDGNWIPISMHVRDDSAEAARVLGVCRRGLGQIHAALPEYDLVRHRRPIVVAPPVWRETLRGDGIVLPRSCGYVAVPVIEHGTVIGMLHADRYQQRCRPDDLDRDRLWTFAEGLGIALDSATSRDSLRALSVRISRAAADLDRETDDGWPPGGPGDPAMPVSLIADARGGCRQPAARYDHTGGLTHREIEILQLMAAGHTNAQVARRLVITEGTVKSHVKRVLRKLGAANRAEAVARWMRATADTARTTSATG